MRKVISALFISLDGVVEAPNVWQFDHFDDGMLQSMEDQLAMQDTVLLGRVTYHEWAPYWPTSTDEPFATYINNIPKVVVSSTLKQADWNNTTIVNGDLKEEINRMKQQSGKAIGTAGSPGLVRSLLENDLLDELILTIHPIIAGKGKRLFSNESDIKRLKLVENKTTETGVIIAHYQPL